MKVYWRNNMNKIKGSIMYGGADEEVLKSYRRENK